MNHNPSEGALDSELTKAREKKAQQKSQRRSGGDSRKPSGGVLSR